MPLQKQFRGLLDHIGQYSLGNLKFEPSPVIQAVTSVEDFMTPPEDITQTGTLTAVLQVATHPQVPEGEFWRARYIGIRGSDTTNSTTWDPVYSDDGSRWFGLDNSTDGFAQAYAAGTISYAGKLFSGQEGFILRPTTRLGFLLRTSTGGGTNLDFTFLIRRQVIKF